MATGLLECILAFGATRDFTLTQSIACEIVNEYDKCLPVPQAGRLAF